MVADYVMTWHAPLNFVVVMSLPQRRVLVCEYWESRESHAVHVANDIKLA